MLSSVEGRVDESKKAGVSMEPAAPASMPGRQRFSAKAASGRSLEPGIQSHIGRELRAVYEQIVNEPVPDRFLKLLADLEKKQTGG